MQFSVGALNRLAKTIEDKTKKTLLVIGKTGVGKSTLCNTLTGSESFPVSSGATSCTQQVRITDGSLMGDDNQKITIIDTVGFDDAAKDTDSETATLIKKLKADVDHVNLFVIVLDGQNVRIDKSLQEMLQLFAAVFTEKFWDHVFIVFTKLSMDEKAVLKRQRSREGVSDDVWARKYLTELSKQAKCEPKYAFIDAMYVSRDSDECDAFTAAIGKLQENLNTNTGFKTDSVRETEFKMDAEKRKTEKAENEKKQADYKRSKAEQERAEANKKQKKAEEERAELQKQLIEKGVQYETLRASSEKDKIERDEYTTQLQRKVEELERKVEDLEKEKRNMKNNEDKNKEEKSRRKEAEKRYSEEATKREEAERERAESEDKRGIAERERTEETMKREKEEEKRKYAERQLSSQRDENDKLKRNLSELQDHQMPTMQEELSRANWKLVEQGKQKSLEHKRRTTECSEFTPTEGGQSVWDETDQDRLAPKFKRAASMIQRGTDPKSKAWKMMQPKSRSEQVGKSECLTFGDPNDELAEKTIIVVGAKNRGKNTLINSMVNHLLDVKVSDKYRFKISLDTNKHSAHVIAYKLNETRYHYKLNIVDIPGFEEEKNTHVVIDNVSASWKSLGLSTQQVHALCFVVRSSDTRLSKSEQRLFTKLPEMFHNNPPTVFATFCDDGNPPVLKTLEDAKIGYQNFHKFNNSAFFADIPDEHDWDKWSAGFEEFFNHLSSSSTSLSLVPEQRKTLAQSIRKKFHMNNTKL